MWQSLEDERNTMDLKEHIIAALTEQLVAYRQWIDGLDDTRAGLPLAPSIWDSRDVLTHCWFWQQRSIARITAAVDSREPVFISLPAGLEYTRSEDTQDINAWSVSELRETDWTRAWMRWHQGYELLLETAQKVPQAALLDPERYLWMQGYPLANVLLGTYDHHVEHLEQ